MVGYWTQDLRSAFANREYLNWFGKSAEDMKGIRMQDLLGEELFRLNEPFIRAALAGKVQEFERVLTKANGEKRVTFAHYIPHLQGDEVLGFFVLILDITERKQLEDALVSIAEERQRALGQELHDNLGQQIAAISYQAKALEKKILASGNIEAEQFAASIATQAQNAVIQCKQLAQGLLPFELEANGLTGALRALASRIASPMRSDVISCAKMKLLLRMSNWHLTSIGLHRSRRTPLRLK
jgi:PAS domain S-box-containing protein